MKVKALAQLATILVLFLNTSAAWSKGVTVRIEIEGEGLAKPIAIIDPDVVSRFSIWSGPNTRGRRRGGEWETDYSKIFIDFPGGPVAKPDDEVPVFELRFYIAAGPDTPPAGEAYKVRYAPKERGGGYMYLPLGNPIVIHGVEGNWFRSTETWEDLVRPIIESALVDGALVSLSAASEETTNKPQEPSVEILGVKIVRGMPESEVRASFPSGYCAEEVPVDANFNLCTVSDGVAPGADGEITFKDGFVYSATRNWFIPEGAEPLEVLMILNDILTRLTGEEDAACAKIATHNDQEPTYTIFALPEKVLVVQMHIMRGRSVVFFKESLRVNPVPDSYRTRGKKMQGTEWCAYVN